MEDYEYKVIPAPQRTTKVKGAKTTGERFAHLLTEALNREAEEGWEYLRAEALPCEERKGLMSKKQSTQTVLVFRRALLPAEAPAVASQPPLHAGAADWPDPDAVAEAHAPAVPAQPAAHSVHAVPRFRAEPRLGQAGSMADEAATRREPALRAQRHED